MQIRLCKTVCSGSSLQKADAVEKFFVDNKIFEDAGTAKLKPTVKKINLMSDFWQSIFSKKRYY